jgi:hypothetical protein
VNPDSSIARAFGIDSNTPCEAVFFSQMGVAIDQPRQHCHFRKIDDFGVLRNREAGAYRLNFVGPNYDDLIAEHRALVGINQPSSLDHCDLRPCGCA